MTVNRIDVEGSPEEETGSNEWKWHFKGFPGTALCPEFFIESFGGCQFLLDRKAVRWSREDAKNPKTSLESYLSEEPLMVEHSESTISISNLCNHEQLVPLTHDAVSS